MVHFIVGLTDYFAPQPSWIQTHNLPAFCPTEYSHWYSTALQAEWHPV